MTSRIVQLPKIVGKNGKTMDLILQRYKTRHRNVTVVV